MLLRSTDRAHHITVNPGVFDHVINTSGLQHAVKTQRTMQTRQNTGALINSPFFQQLINEYIVGTVSDQAQTHIRAGQHILRGNRLLWGKHRAVIFQSHHKRQ